MWYNIVDMKIISHVLVTLLFLTACSQKQDCSVSEEPNKIDSTSVKACFEAIVSSNLAELECFLKNGVDANSKDESGDSLLHLAVRSNKYKLVKLLIKSSADVNIRDNYGETPLYHIEDYISNDLKLLEAAKDMAKLLLEKGADVNVKDNEGWTLLHSAEHEELAKLFIVKGADVNAISNAGHTPLDHALERHDVKIAEFFRSQGGIESDPYRIDMMNAATKGKLKELLKLIEEGANVNSANISGATPLHRAVQNGHKEIVLVLVQNGADVNAGDKSYFGTPLFVVSTKEIAEILINERADVNAHRGLDKWTSLHSAIYRKNADVVKLLLTKGAFVNSRTDNGITPLHMAVTYDSVRIVQLLLGEGADINAKDRWGKTPLDYLPTPGVKELLRNNGAKTGKELKEHDK